MSERTIDEAELERALAEQLPSLRWFGAHAVAGLERVRVLHSGTPELLQVIVRGDDGHRYQAVVGAIGSEVFDAASDPDLALELFRRVLPGADVSKVRPLGAEQSNTSLVFDERYVLKIFRRLPGGPNPDSEVTGALAAAGFRHILPPVALWREGGDDFGVVNELLTDATDGWHLALTSLRDLYDRRCTPEEAPGDFGFEAERLGRVTAELHVAMADTFGVEPADVDGSLVDLESQLARIGLPDELARQVRSVYQELREVDAGPMTRIHGDFHLGQTLRTDTGWYIIDFEGESARPVEERRRPSSPLRDVAGMVRSFQYAAQVALREHSEPDAELRQLAGTWEDHNAERFLAGYEGCAEVDRVLPAAESRHVVLRAFALDKAVYEIGYERGHRPDWVDIPLSAVTHLVASVT